MARIQVISSLSMVERTSRLCGKMVGSVRNRDSGATIIHDGMGASAPGVSEIVTTGRANLVSGFLMSIHKVCMAIFLVPR